jgi:hypothetical protein
LLLHGRGLSSAEFRSQESEGALLNIEHRT